MKSDPGAATYERPANLHIRRYPHDMGSPHPGLTYATATPEQVAEVRQWARQQLAEARRRCTPERLSALRERLCRGSSEGPYSTPA